MTIWTTTNKFGVAIWNYRPDPNDAHKLELLIGEPVHIYEESKDWFYGYSLVNNSDQLGIFPKSVTTTQEYAIRLSNKYGDNYDKYSFEQEVILTLREWGKKVKRLYIDGDSLIFNNARDLIIEVISCYQRLKSGKLTFDESRSLKIEIIEKLDLGNKLLGLDLIIRNDDGFILSPLETNIIEYYHQHQLSDKRTSGIFKGLKTAPLQNEQFVERPSKRNSIFRISGVSNGSQSSTEFNISNQSSDCFNNCNGICVTLANFICTIRQDMDIVMSLYDAKDNRFLSENFVVKWDKQGLVQNIDKLNDMRVVFTDLSKNDLKRKLFLVCQIIRVGTMNVDGHKAQYRKSMHSNAKKDVKSHDELRRPCGIAVYDLIDFIRKPEDFDENREVFFPFIPYYEKDSMDSLIRKSTKDLKDQKDSLKTQGLYITIRYVFNCNMTLLEHTTYVARKIGFPDIIMPDDYRNDLYLTLVSGEFYKGNKQSERNIEVSVKVVDAQGNSINDALSIGTENLRSFYKSVVYYHDDKPKWMETIKVALSIEDFRTSHLKFTFKHRSSNENKDKNEKPFAISFIQLMNDNGTPLKNNEFNLFVYKVDGKKFNENDTSYISMPSSKLELEEKFNIDSCSHSDVKQFFSKKFPSSNYVCSPKDNFTISIVVCSTKLAQNIDIFGLLNWKEKKDSLEEILLNIKNLDGGDVVKFLNDALDALFEIWMDESTPNEHGPLVFNALVKIIRLLLQEKYMHFQRNLNEYIERNFSATLIYEKLIDCFKQNIENQDIHSLYNSVTCMEYIFKFIVRSRTLFSSMNGDENKENFDLSLGSLLELISNLMPNPDKQLIKVKLGILKYFPRIIRDIISVFEPSKLSLIVVQLLQNVPSEELLSQKLACMHDIVYTELFTTNLNCRRELLPIIDVNLKGILLSSNDDTLAKEDGFSEKMVKCLSIISDILIILNRQDIRFVRSDISEMTISLLGPLIDAFLCLEGKNWPNIQHLWSIIISLLYLMTDFHYSEYFKYLKSNNELIPFFLKLLQMFQVSTKGLFPDEWTDMNLVQNSVMLKTMNHIATFIKERDFQRSQFEFKFWKELFLTAIAFITQKSLQLENFSKLKRKRIESFSRDMRFEMAVLVRSLWHFLGSQKKEFIPFLIGPLLEAALIPVFAIRQNTIVIFFDMFYFCSEYIIRNEVITKLDSLITSGKGDSQFRLLFESVMLSYCECQPQKIKDDCAKFVQEVNQQIEKLLVYRDIVKNDEGYESLMSCIIDLLDFYDKIDRREMYIQYLYKLYDLHVKYENYIEAAYTISKHAMLLEWSDTPLEEFLRNEQYQTCHTHKELKEMLYDEMIKNFNEGQLWEAGIVYCKELAQQYENVFFDYTKLSQLFNKMSQYYSDIVTKVRVEPEYFHVTYFGNGFPVLFRGKSFIYRGRGYERLVDFTKRLQDQFPTAKLLNKLDQPDEQILQSNEQYLAIFRVDPVIEESVKTKFSRSLVNEKIVKYYQFNEIKEFLFSRLSIKTGKSAPNEFASMWIERSKFETAFPLPGILCRSEVVHKHTFELNPLENAIDTMEKINEKTKNIILQFLNDTDNSQPLHILLMHINGIVNSDVQGGVTKYEEAFFQPPHAENYKEEDLNKLKELFAVQIPLLDFAIKVIEDKQQKQPNQANMEGLYRHLLESFSKMKEDIEAKYGKRELPPDLRKIKESRLKEPQITNKHRLSNASNLKMNEHRASIDNSDGNFTISKSRSKLNKVNGSTANITNTLRFRKKENRRMNSDSSNSVYASNANISQSQWYTDSQSSMTNLNYTPDPIEDHPMDTFTERTSNSRPSSGHFNHRASIQSHLSLSVFHYNPSMSSLTISPVSPTNDSDVPPPLPVKQSLPTEVAPMLPSKNKKKSSVDYSIYQPCKKPEPNGK